MASAVPKQETQRDEEMEIVEDEETKKLRLEKEARASVISGEYTFAFPVSVQRPLTWMRCRAET